MERPNATQTKGNPVTLVGPELRVGEKAPDFHVVDGALRPVTLKDTSGTYRLFSVVPSIDTNICDIQTKTFNARAHQIADDMAIYTVSMDLPFAQNRYVETKRIDKVRMLSDYKDRSFGNAWGLLQKDNQLLARAVVILDEHDVVRYYQLVPDTSKEPNYEEALSALKKVMVS